MKCPLSKFAAKRVETTEGPVVTIRPLPTNRKDTVKVQDDLDRIIPWVEGHFGKLPIHIIKS